MITPEVLLDIRRKRIKKAAGKAGGGQFAMLAKNYADPEYIYRDLEASRALMRRLGCIVVHTEGRAVEETAGRSSATTSAATPPTPTSSTSCSGSAPGRLLDFVPNAGQKSGGNCFCGGLGAGSGQKGAAGCISFTLGSIGVLTARS